MNTISHIRTRVATSRGAGAALPAMTPLGEAANARALFGTDNPLAALIELRQERIRVCAYYKAERRGFAPNHALDDWLAAEQEIDNAFRPL